MPVSTRLIALGLLFSVPCFADATYAVRTVTGQTAQVSADALVTAYAAFQADAASINVKVTNDDGSISVLKPRFLYAGRLVGYELVSYSGADYNGVCAHFKLGLGVTIDVANNPGPQFEGAVLNNDGSLSYVANGHDVLTSVTCRAR